MKKVSQNKFIGGLSIDLDYSLTKINTYINALNIRLTSINSDDYVLTNIDGTNEITTFTSGYIPIGVKVYNNIAFFLCVNKNDTTKNEIGSFPSPNYNLTSGSINQSGSFLDIYQPLYNYSTDTNITSNDYPTFDLPTTGKILLNQYGKFTDVILGYTFDDKVEIELQRSFDNTINIILTSAGNRILLINSWFSIENNNTFKIPNRQGNKDTNLYDVKNIIGQTNLQSNNNLLAFGTFTGLENGGQVKAGNYKYFFKLADSDGNETGVIFESNSVSVYNHATTLDTVVGGKLNEVTSKKVRFELYNLDLKYTYIVPYFSYASSDSTADAIVTYKKINSKIFINGNGYQTFYHTGFEDLSDAAPTDVNVLTANIKSFRTIAQCQDYLFGANVSLNTNSFNNDLYEILKEYANKCFAYPVQEINKFNTPASGKMTDSTDLDSLYVTDIANLDYCNPKTIYDYKSYFSGESYPIGLKFHTIFGDVDYIFPTVGIDTYQNNDITTVGTVINESSTNQNAVGSTQYTLNRITSFANICSDIVYTTTVGSEVQTLRNITWNTDNWGYTPKLPTISVLVSSNGHINNLGIVRFPKLTETDNNLVSLIGNNSYTNILALRIMFCNPDITIKGTKISDVVKGITVHRGQRVENKLLQGYMLPTAKFVATPVGRVNRGPNNNVTNVNSRYSYRLRFLDNSFNGGINPSQTYKYIPTIKGNFELVGNYKNYDWLDASNQDYCDGIALHQGTSASTNGEVVRYENLNETGSYRVGLISKTNVQLALQPLLNSSLNGYSNDGSFYDCATTTSGSYDKISNIAYNKLSFFATDIALNELNYKLKINSNLYISVVGRIKGFNAVIQNTNTAFANYSVSKTLSKTGNSSLNLNTTNLTNNTLIKTYSIINPLNRNTKNYSSIDFLSNNSTFVFKGITVSNTQGFSSGDFQALYFWHQFSTNASDIQIVDSITAYYAMWNKYNAYLGINISTPTKTIVDNLFLDRNSDITNFLPDTSLFRYYNYDVSNANPIITGTNSNIINNNSYSNLVYQKPIISNPYKDYNLFYSTTNPDFNPNLINGFSLRETSVIVDIRGTNIGSSLSFKDDVGTYALLTDIYKNTSGIYTLSDLKSIYGSLDNVVYTPISTKLYLNQTLYNNDIKTSIPTTNYLTTDNNSTVSNANPLRKTFYEGDCYVGNFLFQLNYNYSKGEADSSLANHEYSQVTVGTYFSLVSESKVNPYLRYTDDTNLFPPFSKGTAVTNDAKFCNTIIYDPNNSSKVDSKLYNLGYNYFDISKSTTVYPTNAVFIQTEFKNRIYSSLKNVQSGYVNNYKTFLLQNYKDYPNKYGEIVHIENYGNNLLVIMEHGIGLVNVNERVATANDSLGKVYILPNEQFSSIMNMLNESYGTKWQSSVVKTDNYIYCVDIDCSKILKIGTHYSGNEGTFGIKVISDNLLQSYLIPKFEHYKNVTFNNHLTNVTSHYDRNNNEVVFSFYKNDDAENTFTLCYNEKIGNFVSFYSYNPNLSFNLFSKNYSISNGLNTDVQVNKIYQHNYKNTLLSNKNKFYDNVNSENSIIKFVVNDNFELEKVFDDLIIVCNNVLPITINYYVQGGNTEQTILGRNSNNIVSSNAVYKEEKAYIQIPRIKNITNKDIYNNLTEDFSNVKSLLETNSRFKGKAIIIELIYNTNKDLKINSVLTSYRNSKS